MQWSEAIESHIGALRPVPQDVALCKRLYSVIDLTSLSSDDDEARIAELCSQAESPLGHVAAVCVYPKFVSQVVGRLAGTKIKTATVVNFPKGDALQQNVLAEISQSVTAGVQEIDVVFPYERYLAGEAHYCRDFVHACKLACGEDIALKVILETGALGDPAIIADACYDALAGGADFLKTSTGKISEGATLEAAATMLLVIKHTEPQAKRKLGLKVSGGIRDISQASQYLELADQIMGEGWATPDTFRIGASRLVNELLSQ